MFNTMDEDGDLPLKRVELSLSKFNEVAIPHHLDLLRQHKTNILKYEAAGEYSLVEREQRHARRVAGQLRALLGELAALRARVRAPDRDAFDRRTRAARDRTNAAILDYLETSPLSANRHTEEESVCGSVVSGESVLVLDTPLQVQEEELRARTAVLEGWSALQSDLHALHQVCQQMHHMAVLQREQVDRTAGSVDTTADNVSSGRAHLLGAERLRAGAWGVCGGAAGALVGGPLGLLVGLKAGAAAALAGTTVGYLAGAIIGRKRKEQLALPAPEEQGTDERPDDKKDR